eukprot:Skav229416  [mRNA]  locus=scaffold2297:142714:146368:+ [translate_table: standard]
MPTCRTRTTLRSRSDTGRVAPADRARQRCFHAPWVTLELQDVKSGAGGRAAEMIQRAEAAMAAVTVTMGHGTPPIPIDLEELPAVEESETPRKDGQIYLSQLPFSVTEKVTGCPRLHHQVLLLVGIDYKGRAIRVRRRQPRKPSAGKLQAPTFKPRGAKRKKSKASKARSVRKHEEMHGVHGVLSDFSG